ncbi:N-acylneuraminate cytidylyltransferase-like [Asterias amurensis]|uniref:N-acylneuraminate cytidylyltransferase-like n=1 Tax=Asterias amurensis TaxID=7602 RepID=UPI003AB49B14
MENSDVQSSPAGGHFAAVVLALDGDFGTGKRSGNPHWLAGRPLEGFAVRSALLSRQVDGIVVISSTSVLLQPHHVTEACRLIGEGYDSVVSISNRNQAIMCRTEDNVTEDPAMESSDHRVPQGSLMGPVIQLEGFKCNVNGLFFCATREVINGGRIIGDRVAKVEIDTKYTPNLNPNHDSDWLLMEQRVMRIGCMDNDSLVPVCLVVLAGDSVITDNQVYDGENGIRYSSYNVGDVEGIRMLLEREIEVQIITETENLVVEKVAEKVGVTTSMLCAADKAGTLNTWRLERRLGWNRVAFMGGNSAGDLDCLQRVSDGHGAVPCDAGPDACRAATFVSRKAGGRGALREFCNFLIALLDRNNNNTEMEEAHL